MRISLINVDLPDIDLRHGAPAFPKVNLGDVAKRRSTRVSIERP
jgi:hypothetical protein